MNFKNVFRAQFCKLRNGINGVGKFRKSCGTKILQTHTQTHTDTHRGLFYKSCFSAKMEKQD